MAYIMIPMSGSSCAFYMAYEIWERVLIDIWIPCLYSCVVILCLTQTKNHPRDNSKAYEETLKKYSRG
jgi:hypothetical protein